MSIQNTFLKDSIFILQMIVEWLLSNSSDYSISIQNMWGKGLFSVFKLLISRTLKKHYSNTHHAFFKWMLNNF